MNVSCPECSVVYRIDPARLPESGVRTRCRACETSFRIRRSSEPESPGVVVKGERIPAPTAAPAPQAGGVTAGVAGADAPLPPAPAGPAFGPQDPKTRAHRLARALVSDIKVYNRDRWMRSRAEGTLRKDFRDEILKSWEEYVEQVGGEMAKRTPFFRDALNDILAEGQRVF
jgi:predicted Zn finger-like uncharacterized protein